MATLTNQSWLAQQLLAVNNRFKLRPAIWVGGKTLNYVELFQCAIQYARFMQNTLPPKSRVALLVDRKEHAYCLILACVLAGHAYVPLNPLMPLARNQRLLQLSQANMLCIATSHAAYRDLLINTEMPILLLDKREYSLTSSNTIYYATDILQQAWPPLIMPTSSAPAYILFTSGTTGTPKGVQITHANLSAYLRGIQSITSIAAGEHFSQLSELTFDLSVHDIFVCWLTGGTLFVLPENYMFGTKKFLQQHAIHYYLATPSTISILQQMGHLTANAFPNLKQTFFCGEPLSHVQACQWHAAAPNSQITNLYGPTEATIAFTYHHWQPNNTYNIVPIGKPLSFQRCQLINEDTVCAPNEVGELLLTGSQVIQQYFTQEKNHAFRRIKAREEIYYCSGDLAQWDPKVGYIFHGRKDDQWQIRGHRVERLEIEMVLKKITATEHIAVAPIMNEANYIEGVIAFTTDILNTEEVLQQARLELPESMVPRKIIRLEALPYNQHGKIDYRQLTIYQHATA